ncbi:MAG: SMI1/KNR4 family protein [Deltaproteobacteria bacterium]|nr:SMI1/KNR4 family protein [Deltaproteobacteria bacterium]
MTFSESSADALRITNAILTPWARVSRFQPWVPLLPHAPLDTSVISDLANEFGVTLPQEYTHFLAMMGNGGLGPTYYPLHSFCYALFDSKAPHQRFAFEEPITLVSSEHLEHARRRLAHVDALELASLTVQDPEGVSNEALLMSGCVCVGESGCGLDYFLVVDQRSKRYGQVWLSCDLGTAPVASNFSIWYEARAGDRAAKAEGLKGDDASAWKPDHPHVVSQACKAIDRWVGLVQRWTDRMLAKQNRWTCDAVNDIWTRTLEGDTFQWERQYALASYSMAREIVGDDPTLLTAMAWAEVLLGLPSAEVTLEALGHAHAEAGFLRAEHRAARGDVVGAIEICRLTLAEHDGSQTTWLALVSYLIRQRELEEAVTIVDRLTSIDEEEWEPDLRWTYQQRPQGVEYLFHAKAVLAAARDDHDHALQWIARALEEGLPRREIARCPGLDVVKALPKYHEMMVG